MTKIKTRNVLLAVLVALFALSLTLLMIIKPVKAMANVTIAQTAVASTDESGAGIKFTGYVNSGFVLDEDTTAGVLVVKGTVVAQDITASTADVIDVKAEEYADDQNNDGGKVFNVVLSGITEEDYVSKYTARAYVLDNGSYTYSDNVCNVSLAQIASEELAETKEVDEDLMSYVDAANPVVKVNGEILDPSKEVFDMTITATTTLDVTVEPSYIKPSIMVHHKNLSIEGDSVKTTKILTNLHDAQYVTIDVGSYSWLIYLYTSKWTEDDLTGGMLATFDKEEYIGAILDGSNDGAGLNNSVTWLDPKTAKAETGRESGMIKVDAGAWDVVTYNLNTPIKFSDLEKGIYVKYKMPADFEYEGATIDANNGVMYGGINGIQKALSSQAGPNWSSATTYKAANGDWNILRITRADIMRYFSSASEITCVTFMPVYKACTYYVDEIGIIEDYVDTTVEEGVVVDFDEEKSIEAIQNGTDNGSGINTAVTWLSATEAKAETGRESGMIKVDAGAWDVVTYNLNTPIKFSDLEKGIYVKYKMPADFEYEGATIDANNGVMYGGINGIQKALSSQAGPNWSSATTYKAANGDWNILRITRADIMRYFSSASEITCVTFMPVNKGCVYYIDEIGVIDEYVDATLEKGVLSDFDEEESITSIQNGIDNGNGTNTSVTWLSATEAKQETGRESGMLKVVAEGGWRNLVYKFKTPLNTNTVGGFYVKYKMPVEMEWDDNDATNGVMYFNVNNTKSVAIAKTMFRTYTAANGEWNVLAVTKYDLQKTFGVTEVTEIQFMPITTGCTYYIDEIGIYSEDANVINSFDGNSEVQDKLIFNKFSEGWHTVQPGDTSYPTNIGATSGLLVVSPSSIHGKGINLSVGQPIKTSTVSKIKIRMYVPTNSKYNSTNTALSIGFNETTSNNHFEVSDQRFFVTRGQWNEIEVSVSGFTSEYIFSMGIYKRLWDQSDTAYSGETNWYIDYIKVIPKA